ncbi:unnamed protein product [Strongylus vulgaris]|uniref:Uncharacterized protein n=1 Tax=Strongylus vulgaris TaxID=40348 RepID=A0A3P7J235_STRVU|nr:unnamed protein product [Strongylus vulgaris]
MLPNLGDSVTCDVPVSSRSQIPGVEGTLLADVTSPHGKNHRIVFYRDINVFAFELLEEVLAFRKVAFCAVADARVAFLELCHRKSVHSLLEFVWASIVVVVKSYNYIIRQPSASVLPLVVELPDSHHPELKGGVA